MRLDTFEGITASVVVPGKPDESELIARITSDDPDVRMPPPKSLLKVTAAEKRQLQAWIADGARVTEHWAFRLAARVLHADGGPTRNGFLMQFSADMIGLELDVSEVSESSAWGAASAGLLGLGVYKSLEDLAALPRSARTYRPQMPRDAADQLHVGWQTAVRRVL